jgi:hypothetical protein
MSQKDHEHRGTEGPAHGHKHEHQHGQPTKSRPLHRDWRLWAGVVLMLIAIGVYVLTLNESLVPSGNGQLMPAAADVPAPVPASAPAP